MISLLALYFGAEWTLEAAEKIGRFFRLSPLVIGILIVGFGTSLPEFVVSHLACLKGAFPVALGNLIGSNLANLFLVMGLASLFSSVPLLQAEVKTQLCLHLGVMFLLALVLFFLSLGILSMILFLSCFSFYLWKTLQKMEKEESPGEKPSSFPWKTLLLLSLGLVFLYLGGRGLVDSGVWLAKLMGISSYVVSAIFLAIGTSLPELMTAIVATYKKKDASLIVGNILGSNIFNTVFVLGSLGIYKISITLNFRLEMLALGMGTFFLLALYSLKKNFNRWYGLLFLGVYFSLILKWIS